MQINLSQNIKNVSNYPKIADKRSYATPVSFCGVDVFERGAVKFSKELCVETINKIFKSESDSEVKSAIETIMALKKVDPGLIELDRLGYKYLDTISKNDKNLETLSLEDKKNLLRHEENMHWEELETPQVGLVRTILDMRNKGIEDDFVPAMQVCTLNGLSKLRAVYHDLGMKITPDEKRFNLLKTLIEDTPDGAPFSTRIKTAALGVSSAVTKDRDSFVELAKYVKETTNDKDLKIYASGCIDSQLKYNELELFDKLSSTDLKDYEKKSVIKMLAYKKSKKLAEQLPSIINDKNTPHEVKIAAVWATGKCQSGENFDLLNKIANNSDTVDLEEREMAIHSLALYLRTM